MVAIWTVDFGIDFDIRNGYLVDEIVSSKYEGIDSEEVEMSKIDFIKQ